MKRRFLLLAGVFSILALMACAGTTTVPQGGITAEAPKVTVSSVQLNQTDFAFFEVFEYDKGVDIFFLGVYEAVPPRLR